jgi:hypothetical protein
MIKQRGMVRRILPMAIPKKDIPSIELLQMRTGGWVRFSRSGTILEANTYIKQLLGYKAEGVAN